MEKEKQIFALKKAVSVEGAYEALRDALEMGAILISDYGSEFPEDLCCLVKKDPRFHDAVRFFGEWAKILS